MRPSVIEIRSVSKQFAQDQSPVIDGLSLAAYEGDFISLIGPSGCGKSTLLRLIANLIAPTNGAITRPSAPKNSLGSELAYVFQEPTLLPWLNVTRNIEVPLALRGVDSATRRETSQRVLSLVRLSEKAEAYPRELSGGQKMRVSIARALAVTPRLLLLDEPFGALDEMTRDHLNEELLAIRQQEAWTAFFVTHSVAEAVFLSNRIVILAANPGRIAHEVAVPFPYPRNAETRLNPEYHRLASQVSSLLRSVETNSTSITA